MPDSTMPNSTMPNSTTSGPSTILPSTCPYSTSDERVAKVNLDGQCSINGGGDQCCQAVELAIDRMSVRCEAAVAAVDRVVFSFPEFGLVEAVVTSTYRGGFTTRFDAALDSKLALYLAWLQETPHAVEDCRRAASRIVPVKKVVTLSREGEPESMARIIDLSRAGVSVTTSKELVPDEEIMVGPRPAHVVRVFTGGAAIGFDELIEKEQFDPMIELRATGSPPSTV